MSHTLSESIFIQNPFSALCRIKEIKAPWIVWAIKKKRRYILDPIGSFACTTGCLSTECLFCFDYGNDTISN